MSKKILLCDDAAFMRMMLKNILTKASYEIVGEAENGQDVVNKVKTLNPDLIMMDITMPEMNGIEALKEIKAINKDTKVIMCSALGQKEMIMQCIKEGAMDFVVKPFEEQRVLEAVGKAFA